MRKTQYMTRKAFFITINFILASMMVLIGQLLVFSQTSKLEGIDCNKLIPTDYKAAYFSEPVKPVGNKTWKVTNHFGNVLTAADLPGLPSGYWQHTGVDYLLNGSSADSQNQKVYAAADGVVVFSTKTKSNKNPVPSRGGLVIIKHVAPANRMFSIPSFEQIFKAEVRTHYLKSSIN